MGKWVMSFPLGPKVHQHRSVTQFPDYCDRTEGDVSLKCGEFVSFVDINLNVGSFFPSKAGFSHQN
jgi:hypothetical protein